jgi:hypothetical protein
MQYSYYRYSSNTNPLILFFVKKDNLIFITIKYEDYDKAYYKQEELIAKCEMNVEKIRALDNIVPENFPKDIYMISYLQRYSLNKRKLIK